MKKPLETEVIMKWDDKMKSKRITFSAMKYGNHPHYEWQSTIIELTKDYVIVKSEPGRVLHHYSKNTEFVMNNWGIEFFPFNHWFTVSVDISDGKIEGYYCNIAQPSRLVGNSLSFVDLDLDLVCDKDGDWKVVDEKDFIDNMIKYSYTSKFVERVKVEMNNLQKRVIGQQFPFDGTIQKFIDIVLKESEGNSIDRE